MNLKMYDEIKKGILESDLEMDTYGDTCIARLLFEPTAGEAEIDRLNRVARWFELPHQTRPGRDIHGESSFTGLKLSLACHLVEDKLPEDTKALIRKFFTQWDFESKYKSENHLFAFHTARYLYALKYPDTYFPQYEMTAAQMVEEERKYLQEYIRFRARRGWAEFDSHGYGRVVFCVLLNLIDFAEEKLSKYAEMSANVMLLDMIMDCSKEGYYGGAHGRIYENSALHFRSGGMDIVYQMYFGTDCYAAANLELAVTKFRPADYVYNVLKTRPACWENRECKHLHSITYETPHQLVPQVPGNINKRTYVTPDYMIGGVTWQDDYPEGSPAAWYAHHQQHEWELTLLSELDLRIFSHHPGSCGPEGKEHGYWTGDLFCCCGQFFSDRNIAMATYDIPEKEMDFIHAAAPLTRVETEQEDNYLWMKSKADVYAVLWFSQGISQGCEEYKDIEVRSYGRKHGVVCTVATKAECGGYEAFKEMVKAGNPQFDPETMTLSYGNLKMNRRERFIDGEKVVFPYETYDSPCVYSKWGSGVIETATAVIDFSDWGSVTYKN